VAPAPFKLTGCKGAGTGVVTGSEVGVGVEVVGGFGVDGLVAGGGVVAGAVVVCVETGVDWAQPTRVAAITSIVVIASISHLTFLFLI